MNERLKEALRKPFPSSDIEWRVQRVVKTKDGSARAVVLAYITARAVMDRLDEVFGVGGWRDNYVRWGEKGVKCHLEVKIGDEWVWKEDGADETDVESTKGGFSDALKRAVVKLGIGRYLYRLEETWVDIKPRGKNYVNDRKSGVSGYWDDPPLPDWALPEEEQGKTRSSTATTSSAPSTEEPPRRPPFDTRTSKPNKPKAESKPQEDDNKSIDRGRARAIENIGRTLERKNEGFSIEAFIQDLFGKSAIGDLTIEEGKSAIEALNKLLNNR